jgi:hypothetical protein
MVPRHVSNRNSEFGRVRGIIGTNQLLQVFSGLRNHLKSQRVMSGGF